MRCDRLPNRTHILLWIESFQFSQPKSLLPEYDVFDEARHFEPAHSHRVHSFRGTKIALSLCEDLWSSFDFGGRRLYPHDPMKRFVEEGAEVLINLSASPYTLKKHNIRKALVCGAAARFSRPVVYCNLVGGNDELVFDGVSFVANSAGKIIAIGKAFAEDIFLIDLSKIGAPEIQRTEMDDAEEIFGALVLGLRDYMRKCFFKKAVIGLSGGIDSAVVAALAAEAIGANNVTAIMMPSRFTSRQSTADARAIIHNLKIAHRIVSIDDVYSTYRKALGFSKGEKAVSVSEENIQARIRGNILMAVSNREGALVLSTGNKSELSVGYCTLYGDMAGGLAVISDVPKTMVYKIASFINRKREIIPESVVTKAPTAELRPDQTDQDTLPPYDVLDEILKAYVEEHLSAPSIVAMGFDKKTVADVIRRVDFNEYKRRQSPPGFKVTSKAFGIGRRFPIAWKP